MKPHGPAEPLGGAKVNSSPVPGRVAPRSPALQVGRSPDAVETPALLGRVFVHCHGGLRSRQLTRSAAGRAGLRGNNSSWVLMQRGVCQADKRGRTILGTGSSRTPPGNCKPGTEEPRRARGSRAGAGCACAAQTTKPNAGRR